MSKVIKDEKGVPQAIAENPGLRTAPDFCRWAADIMAERGKQYDQPDGERDMGKTVQAFNVITGHDLTEAEGWAFMVLLKMTRQWAPGHVGYHEDSAVDMVAYASLTAEAKQLEGKKVEPAAVITSPGSGYDPNNPPLWTFTDPDKPEPAPEGMKPPKPISLSIPPAPVAVDPDRLNRFLEDMEGINTGLVQTG